MTYSFNEASEHTRQLGVWRAVAGAVGGEARCAVRAVRRIQLQPSDAATQGVVGGVARLALHLRPAALLAQAAEEFPALLLYGLNPLDWFHDGCICHRHLQT